MSSPLLAGIDVGGTTTRIALADESGRVLGRGRAAGAGFTEVAPAESTRRLSIAWREACAEAGHDPVRPVTALFAGFGSVAALRDVAIARRCLRLAGIKARHLVAGHDSENAQAGARPEGAGLHVIAGTGSVVIVRDEKGQVHRVGGWGPGIGDEGAAWWIACAALKALTARADAGLRPDALGRDILLVLRIREPRELLGAVFGRGLGRAGFAALARVVCTRAGGGDRAARAILAAGADALASQVVCAAGHARLAFPMMTVSGGMFEHAPGYIRSLIAAVRRRGLGVRLAPTEGCPLAGALLLARRQASPGSDSGTDLTFVRRVAANLKSRN